MTPNLLRNAVAELEHAGLKVAAEVLGKLVCKAAEAFENYEEFKHAAVPASAAVARQNERDAILRMQDITRESKAQRIEALGFDPKACGL